MFKSLDVVLQDKEIEKFYQRHLSKRTESLRTKLLDNSTQLSEFSKIDFTKIVLPKFLKLSQKIGLGILSWYMPEEIRILLQLELRECWGGNLEEVMEVLLTSKRFALTWLLRCSKWSESDFYGNILTTTLERIWSVTDFQRRSSRKIKRYTGYCRGYQEHSRRTPSPLKNRGRRKVKFPISVEEELQQKLEKFSKIQSLLTKVREESQKLYLSS